MDVNRVEAAITASAVEVDDISDESPGWSCVTLQ
jgi:hypothetical protein